MTGPMPKITIRKVTSMTTKGVMIRSRALGMTLRSFFSSVAPIKAVRMAVRTLPWQPTMGIAPKAMIASTPLLGSATE